MGKTYSTGWCWVCGESLSSAGFADYHHNMRHVREGLMIEHRRRFEHRVRGQLRSYPAVEFERVKGVKLVQLFYFVKKSEAGGYDVYREDGTLVKHYRVLKDIRQAFSPFQNRIRRGRPRWWHFKRWKSHYGTPPELDALDKIDYWFRQYLITKVNNEQ